MNKKIILLVIVIAVVVGGLSFWAGTKYVASISSSSASSTATRTRSGAGFAGRTGGGSVFGQVISKDATSITVASTGGSSTIVFLTSSTPVMKMVAGSSSDVAIGQNVTVSGTANSDGSFNAQSIQIRPAQSGAPAQTPNKTN